MSGVQRSSRKHPPETRGWSVGQEADPGVGPLSATTCVPALTDGINSPGPMSRRPVALEGTSLEGEGEFGGGLGGRRGPGVTGHGSRVGSGARVSTVLGPLPLPLHPRPFLGARGRAPGTRGGSGNGLVRPQ